MKYALLPEQHKDGRLHMHMLIGAAIKKRWLKDNAFASGAGFMADSEPLTSGKRGAYYVSKYVGKSLGVEQWPVKFRRIRTSQKWPEVNFDVGEDEIALDWRLVRYRADLAATEGIRKGLKFAGFESVKIIIK